MDLGVILHAALGIVRVFIKNPKHADEYDAVTKELSSAMDELDEVRKANAAKAP